MTVEDHQISFSLEVNVDPAYQNLRRVQTLLFRTLGLLRRLGLPESLDSAIGKMQMFVSTMNQARLAVVAFQKAAGPIGWALALLGLVTTAASVVETSTYIYEVGGR